MENMKSTNQMQEEENLAVNGLKFPNSFSKSMEPEIIKKKKNKRKNHSQLGKDFVAPDGNWGWLVVIAAGCSNLCTFPMLQQFGLIFRERLSLLNIGSSEITTIINMNQAFICIIGLLNGFLFKTFSYRKIAFCGAFIVFVSIYLTSYSDTFIKFLITFSALYGVGCGLSTSANSLSLNTYFKEKRRIATGFSWTLTALGPILLPFVVTFLLSHYGVQGTITIFSAISLNAVAFSLLLQPVRWHTKKAEVPSRPVMNSDIPEIQCKYCRSLKEKNHSVFSSQYLYNADDYYTTGYEIIDPGTPMLSRANDGWYSNSGKRSMFGSKMSLSRNEMGSRKESNQNLVISNRPSTNNLGAIAILEIRDKKIKEVVKDKIIECPTEDCPSWKAPQDVNSLEFSSKPIVKSSSRTPLSILAMKKNLSFSETTASDNIPPLLLKQVSEDKYLMDNHSNRSFEDTSNSKTTSRHMSFRKRANTFNIEKEVLDEACNKLKQFMNENSQRSVKCTCEDEIRAYIKEKELNIDEDSLSETKNYTFWQKFSIFFDLDLLKDFSYINIMVGITIANFAEMNFSVLTPFVLADFGLEKTQVASFMSLLGVVDISVRFFIPFIAGKIGWENRTFFIFGVMGMALGRVVLAHYHSFHMTLVIAAWIGFNKGLRTIFMALCIPSHVPLDRLPGATGLHLLFSGIFYLAMGPVVGWVRDGSSFTVTLHCLNITTYLTAISWGFEKLYFKRKEMKLREQCNLS